MKDGLGRTDTNIVYAATDHLDWGEQPNTYDSIFWKYNYGTWTDLSLNLKGDLSQSPFADGFITDIEINPINSNVIWVCFGVASGGINKVFISYNAGTTWEPLSQGYPNKVPANNLKFEPIAGYIYVCTDVGVFYYDDSSILYPEDYTWTRLGDGLPRVIITNLDINLETQKAFVSTYGRGIWTADLPVCYYPEGDIVITSNTTWSHDDVKCGDIFITNNSTLTISASIIQSSKYSLEIESGSAVIITNIGELQVGSLIIEDGGSLNTNSGSKFRITDP